MAYRASDEDDFFTINIDGSRLDALAGNDNVLVNASGARVLGNIGNDWLSASIHLVAYDETTLTTDLRGGAGDDQIYAALSIQNDDIGYDTEISATLAGGAGNDVIWLDLRSSDAPLTGRVSGGAGDDTISVVFDYLPGGMGTLGESLDLRGGAGNDTITAHLFLDNSGYPELVAPIYGGAGDDTISTFVQASGNDGGVATSRVFGGSGDDTIRSVVEGVDTGFGGEERNRASGGAGDDRIVLKAGGTNAFDLVENRAQGGSGDDVILATASLGGEESTATNLLRGEDGADHLTARLELNASYEASGVNTLEGGAGADALLGTVTISPDSFDVTGHSELWGGEGADRLTVRGGEDNVLEGNQGNDTLRGGAGADLIVGGQGADWLRGGGGADTFRFGVARGTSLAERDRIEDFHIGQDVIDLSKIDADPGTRGDQGFVFAAGPGAGRVWVTEAAHSDASILHADTGRATLVVALLDGAGVSAADYHASDFLL